MDPEQTIRDMIQHLRERNEIEARECFENLMDWINKGGFVKERDEHENTEMVS